MKNLLKYLAILMAFANGELSYADAKPAEELDTMGTCTSVTQLSMKERVKNWFHNYETWNIAALYAEAHPDYISWHASRAFQAANTAPEKRDLLPFGNGIYNKSGFIENLAKIAFRYGMDNYLLTLKRIECLGDDTVVVSTIFNGTALIRKPETGEALYKYELKDIPTRFTVVEKDSLIYRYIVDLADATSANLGLEMAKLMSGPPNVLPGEFKPLRYDDLLANFKKQVEGK